ncbi:MAG: hypothetical protein RLY43_2194, partial [Bacteroidota bacterium]
MRMENKLLSRQNMFNNLHHSGVGERYADILTERLIKPQNVYSSITGQLKQKLREPNDDFCFHPTQRLPLHNPMTVGRSW